VQYFIVTYLSIKKYGMEDNKYVEVAPGIWGMKIVFVNIYMVAIGETEWILVDAGLKGSAASIQKMAASLFGEENPPSAIVLTHGHFDHVGALKDLLKTWDVPVYAHPLEIPYLTGLSSYPPADPTVGGGLMSAISFMYPKGPIDLGLHLHPLSKDGSIPVTEDWISIHTPGHSPGHISLFRASDKVLIAGDAFVTTKAESAYSVLTSRKQISGPPKYFTPNWVSAALSVKKLHDLRPAVAATGHGPAMSGDELTQGLDDLVNNFKERAIPSHGRYVNEPAKTNRKGVQHLPPAPLNKTLLGSIVAISALLAFGVIFKYKRKFK
jgi:glyoxylase-like metal-dependent hydrolase (beta-lactamase superfamily II)